MILTTHAVVGAAFSNLFPNNKTLGFIFAFFSHYILDMLPHSDYKVEGFLDSKTKTIKSIFNNIKALLSLLTIAADSLAGIVISILIFARDEKSLLTTIIGAIAAMLPDFLQLLYYKFKKQPFTSIQKFHNYFHTPIEMDDRPISGFLIQIPVSLFFVLTYLFLK